MFHCKVGEAVRLRAFYVETKVGKAGLTVTVDYTDESGNATTAQSASAGAIAGEYYYTLTPDAAGMWCFVFKTATSTVDQQHLGGVIAVESAYTAARAANLDNLDAAVSSRLASASYSAPPSAASNADAVWDEALVGHVVAGSAGVALAAAGGSSDPLLNSVPGTYAQGTAGAALGRIGVGTIRAVSPVGADGTSLELVRGDSYLNADAEALVWSDTGTSWPDLTAIPAPTAITLTIRSADGGEALTATATATAARAIRVDVTAAKTASLPLGTLPYDIQASWAAGRVRTLVIGQAIIRQDQTR